jgi:hypothetical protein
MHCHQHSTTTPSLLLPPSPHPHSPLWLDVLALLVEVGEQLVIRLVEQVTCQARQPGVDVPAGACAVCALNTQDGRAGSQ